MKQSKVAEVLVELSSDIDVLNEFNSNPTRVFDRYELSETERDLFRKNDMIAIKKFVAKEMNFNLSSHLITNQAQAIIID